MAALRMALPGAFFGALLMAGCTPFPDLRDAASDAALAQPYPDLVPLSGLDTQRGQSRITPDTVGTIEARIAALEARADRLRGDIVDPGTRRRMARGVTE
ncbi:hypothetical protein [Roseovarius aquimarinus]|uniref:Lipoprotein n=1 Tax=Roseovarius aquimarinus TaxID=1229156 RepID=A0ABW7I7Q3_9RHOB